MASTAVQSASGYDVISHNDVINHKPNDNRVVTSSSSPNDTNSCPFTSDVNLEGLTITFSNSEDLHPLQIKRKLSQPMSVDFFTNSGFVPYLPEGLMKPDYSRRKVQRRRSESHIRRLSDSEIDHLSYLYSTNFDPTKSPPEKIKEESKASSNGAIPGAENKPHPANKNRLGKLPEEAQSGQEKQEKGYEKPEVYFNKNRRFSSL